MYWLLSFSVVASLQSKSFVNAFVRTHRIAQKVQPIVSQQKTTQQYRFKLVDNSRSAVFFDRLFESLPDNIVSTITPDDVKVPVSVVLLNTTNDNDVVFQESISLIEPLGNDLLELQNSVQMSKSILEVTELQASTMVLSSAAEIKQKVLENQFTNNILLTKDITAKQTKALKESVKDFKEITATTTIIAPSVMKIIQFAVPAIGVWLCNPILSLIDTSVVGLLSGVTQQAALNPATAVTDYAALLIAFMYTGSTNLMAAASEKHGKSGTSTRSTFCGALQLSTYVGFALGVTLLVLSRILLRTIIGNDKINPDVFLAAMKYVKIRAIGMPAAAFIGSAQAACLGMQDIKSPLYVLVAAALVNLVGDLIFVPSTHPLIGGAAGAAWATVISQYAAAGLFYVWLTRKRNSDQQPTTTNSSTKSSGTENGRSSSIQILGLGLGIRDKLPFLKAPTKSIRNKNESSFSTRGFLHGKLRKRDLMKFPPKETIQDFSPYVVPVTSTQVGRVSGYVAMSHVVSSSLGTFNMAAQQVIVSLFYCLCPIADSLSLTAQSFLPSISQKPSSPQRTKALNDTIWNFMKAGVAFGLVLVGAVSFLPLLSSFFTPDAFVSSLVNTVIPLLVVFFAIHGLMCSAEGLLLGQKDLAFLGRMYALFFVVVPYFMMKVKDSALSGNTSVGLTSVWTVFVSYQVVRVASWVARVFYLKHKTNNSSGVLNGST
jgi:Na+-driven multidrug efflux pump